MKIKFKKLRPDAIAPKQAHPGDAGFDLTAITYSWNGDLQLREYTTGIAVEIPRGYVGLIFPRSSVYKTGMTLTNCVGVIDSGYRGDIGAKFRVGNDPCLAYKPGDRIGQLVIVPIPEVEFVEAEELSETERGAGCYGSTGR